jgi:hypothetical protein
VLLISIYTRFLMIFGLLLLLCTWWIEPQVGLEHFIVAVSCEFEVNTA